MTLKENSGDLESNVEESDLDRVENVINHMIFKYVVGAEIVLISSQVCPLYLNNILLEQKETSHNLSRLLAAYSALVSDESHLECAVYINREVKMPSSIILNKNGGINISENGQQVVKYHYEIKLEKEVMHNYNKKLDEIRIRLC